MPAPSPYADRLADVPQRRAELEIGGSRTAYWEYGDPAATRSIVLVHGFRGDHHGLEPVVANLHGLRIISPDLPGFGDSTPFTDGRGHDIDGYGRWLGELLDALGLRGEAVLLGHSFGSIVVAHALANGLPAPRAVLVNPIGAPALSGPRGVLTQLAVLFYRVGALLPERPGFALLRARLVTRIMSLTMSKTREPRLRRWIHEEHDRYFGAFADRRVVLEAFRASVSKDVSGVAERIPVPTLLVAAQQDDITPIEAQRRLAGRIPTAELVEIPDVGHLIHYETPGVAAAAIERFLGEAP
jgi:pimeloyl-ACP methyl ester carboxylesterase